MAGQTTSISNYKLKVENLSAKSTKEDLEEVFSKYGKLRNIILDSRTTKSKLISAHVVYVSSYNQILFEEFQSGVMICGQVATVKRCQSKKKLKENRSLMKEQSTTVGNKKNSIKISGFSLNTSEDVLMKYFKKFGAVDNVKVLYKDSFGRKISKKVGYVEFKNSDGFEAALNEHNHKLRGNNIIVQPRSQKQKPVLKEEDTTGEGIFSVEVSGIISKDEEKLKIVMSQFGKIDKVTFRNRSIKSTENYSALVNFTSEQFQKAALDKPIIRMPGYNMQIRQCNPKSK